MITDQTSAKIAGALFLVATAAYMTGNGLIGSILQSPDYLSEMYPNRNKAVVGTLLEFVNSIAVVGIAVMLFPILKKHSEPIALGYVAFRVIEALLLMAGAIIPLVVIGLSRDFIDAGAPDDSYFRTIGVLAIQAKHIAFQSAMAVLGLFSLLFCYVLYRSKLIPRPLSVLGFIGYASLLASALFELFGYSPGMTLFVPGALFELLFPIWLIARGLKEHAA